MGTDQNNRFSDLAVKTHTCTSGRTRIPSLYGPTKYKYDHHNLIITASGTYKEKEWEKLAEHVIAEAGEEWLFEGLVEYADGLPFLKSERERRVYALELHMRRIFDEPEWVGVVPFNEKWRPDVIDEHNVVLIRTECCKEGEGKVTYEQIKRAKSYNGTISCPFCGQWSEFQAVD